MPTKNYYLKIIKDNDRYYQMIQFLKPFLTNLDVFTYENYPDSIFFLQNNQVIFEYDTKENSDGTHMFWVNYEQIWEVLCCKFDCNYDEIQSLIKIEVEKNIKIGSVTPDYFANIEQIGWKRISKLGR